MLVVGAPANAENILQRPDYSSSRQVGEIQKRGYVRIGVSFDEPFLAWRPTGDGELCGFEIDLAHSIAEQIFSCSRFSVSSYVQLVEMKSSDRMVNLVEHEVDAIVSSFADTLERRSQVSFAGHYLATRFAPLVADKTLHLENPADLRDLTIAVVSGTTGEEQIRQLAPHSKILPFETISECLDAVVNGSAQATWSTTAGNLSYIRDASLDLYQAELKSGIEQWAVGVNKDAHDMARCVNDAIGQLLVTGRLTRMQRRWLPAHS